MLRMFTVRAPAAICLALVGLLLPLAAAGGLLGAGVENFRRGLRDMFAIVSEVVNE